MKTIIVSGADSAYWPLLEGLLLSLENRAPSHQINIGILDLGLTDSQKSALLSRGVQLCEPGWDYPRELFTVSPPSYFRAMTSRPHLPRYFPGYDTYLWIDSDCWIQDWNAVELYIATAKNKGFAATPESDRSYSPLYGVKPATTPVVQWAYSCFSKCYPKEIADRLAYEPVINCGVFCGLHDAPHWDIWSKELGGIFERLREPYFFAEQTAFNVVIRERGLSTGLLPSRGNWMCNRASPMVEAGGEILCEPNPPYQPLGILHLTANSKNGRPHLLGLDGNVYRRSLRYAGHLRTGPDVVFPS